MLFPTAKVKHLFTRNSDHLPILLYLREVSQKRFRQRRRRFRFEAMWLKSEDCAEIVRDNWSSDATLLGNLESCRIGLVNWDRSRFGQVKTKVKELKAELENLHRQQFTADVKQRTVEVKRELEEQLDREELMWKQRAKAQWLAEGDINTRFFHSQASQRAKIDEISGLENEHGQVNSYFKKIFQSRQPTLDEIEDVVDTMEARVDKRINQELAQVFTPAEVKHALFDMYPLKSPTPMVRQPSFINVFGTLSVQM